MARRRRGRLSGPALWASLLIPHLPLPGQWVTGQEMQQKAGLPRYQQVIDGIGALRDAHPDFPLVSKPFKGYTVSEDPRDCGEFQHWRVSSANTTMTRAYWGVIAPYLATLPASAQRNAMQRSFERALEDLTDLIDVAP